MDQFRLTIDLGNAEMSTAEHVADALRTLADRLSPMSRDGNIRDVNGNTVGRWSVRWPEDED